MVSAGRKIDPADPTAEKTGGVGDIVGRNEQCIGTWNAVACDKRRRTGGGINGVDVVERDAIELAGRRKCQIGHNDRHIADTGRRERAGKRINAVQRTRLIGKIDA
jgi:hypothetical protein